MTEFRRRYDYLVELADQLGDDALAVTNLANTATEWYAAHPSDGNLYAVGMGMVTAYALGLALALPDREVVALDATAASSSIPRCLACLRHAKPRSCARSSSTMAAIFRPASYPRWAR
jgi:hypothetical protein